MNAAKIINGKLVSENFCNEMRSQAEELKTQGIIPKLALINASSDPASEIYIAKKEKLAAMTGIASDTYKLPIDSTESEIAKLIDKLNKDDLVHAILLQSPLAKGLDFRKMVNLIDPSKDVDGLTTINQGHLFAGEPCVTACTPLGVLHLIRTVREDISGLHAVILGRSTIVGRPLMSLLLNSNCSVTGLHSRSQNISEICRTADILISAIGRPKFVTRDFIKPGAIVIDVGINRTIDSDGNKKIVGDVDFDEVSQIASAITPVPNGVGPMTVAYLLYNTLKLCQARM